MSEIGFGAWAIGGDAWGPVEDEQSLAAIHTALDLGVTFLDTADVYGNGRSEELVGKAIASRRDGVVVSTKGGLMGHHRDPQREPVYDRPEKVTDAFDASLRRLGTDYIDVYWCHIWWDKAEETDAFLTAFDQLKRGGKARAVGISTDNIDHLRRYNRDGLIDAVQFDYSILNRQAEQDILPYAAEHSLACVVRGPLHKGMLSGKFTADTRFLAGDIREGWADEAWYSGALATVERLRRIAGARRTLAQLALQFVLAQPAVSVAIPGAKDPSQVAQNAGASLLPALSSEELAAVERAAEEAPPRGRV